MANTIMVFWRNSTPHVQRRYFHTLAQSRAYVNRECKEFKDRVRFAQWDGTKYVPFVVFCGQRLTKGEVLTMLLKFDDV